MPPSSSACHNLQMPNVSPPPSFPDNASLSALRAWYAGVGSRDGVKRYCPQALQESQSAQRCRREIPVRARFGTSLLGTGSVKFIAAYAGRSQQLSLKFRYGLRIS